jgi:hypothetical protein
MIELSGRENSISPRNLSPYKFSSRSILLFAMSIGFVGVLCFLKPAKARKMEPVSPDRSALTHPRIEPARLPESHMINVPVMFEEYSGQASTAFKFQSRIGTGYILLGPSQAFIREPRPSYSDATKPASGLSENPGTASRGQNRDELALEIRLVGSNPFASAQEVDKFPARANYFIGTDPSKWRTNIPTYNRIRFHEVYPGIDLDYYGNGRGLEHDFIVAPRGNPEDIRMRFVGAKDTRVDADGNLDVETKTGTLTLLRPVIYQEGPGRKKQIVAGNFVIAEPNTAGLRIAEYDTSKLLIIDPVLVYSTYLGGNNNDVVEGIAVDSAGYMYLAGATASANFPLQNPYQSTLPVTECGTAPSTFLCGIGFVAKLDPTGTNVIFSTYFGGNGTDEEATSIAVDTSGNIFVAGTTNSSAFPTTPGAFSTTYTAGACYSYQCREAYVTKFNPSASALIYSTYLGALGDTAVQFNSLAIDTSGNAYVTGVTMSLMFPTTSGAFQTDCNLMSDDLCQTSFVTKLNASGSALAWSSYLGGSGGDDGTAIAVDSSGSAYVTGSTGSVDFPLMQPFQSTPSGGYITKFKPDGSGLIYSSYLGGTPYQVIINGIALDSSEAAYLTGYTNDQNFPTTPGAFQTTGPNPDSNQYFGFVTKVDSSGESLDYSTFLSGSMQITGNIAQTGLEAIAVDPFGHAYVTGYTNTTDYPLLNPVQSSFGSKNCSGISMVCSDVVLSGLNRYGTGLVFSTYLGGSVADGSDSIAINAAGAIYDAGETASPNFPTVSPYQAANGGGTCVNGPCDDGFVAIFEPPALAFAPGTLSFENQQEGTTSPSQAAVLTNPSSQALTVSIATAGDFAETDNCGSSVAGNSTCTINVTFSPTATGPETGTLTVTQNGAGGPASATLSGTGMDVLFGAANGGSTTQTVTAGNTAMYNLEAASSGFSGTLNLSVNCSTIPAAICSLSTDSIDLSGIAEVPFSVSVTTTPYVAGVVPVHVSGSRPNQGPPSRAIMIQMLACGAILILLMLSTRMRPERRASIRAHAVATATATLFLFIIALVGCGSGGGSLGPSGTPPNNYTVVVTGTGQGINKTIDLTLTVK